MANAGLGAVRINGDHLAESDGTNLLRPKCLHQVSGGLDGMGRNAERASEDIATSARDRRQNRHPRAGAISQHAVDDLVDDPVTAEGDHDVDGAARGSTEVVPMAAVRGLDDVQIDLPSQCGDEDVGDALGGRRRAGIHDEQAAHVNSLG